LEEKITAEFSKITWSWLSAGRAVSALKQEAIRYSEGADKRFVGERCSQG